ncbi:unnamed protein product [Victoria cruziana]
MFCIALQVLPVLPTLHELKAKLLQHEVYNFDAIFDNAHAILYSQAPRSIQREVPGVNAMSFGIGQAENNSGKDVLCTPFIAGQGCGKVPPTCFLYNKRGHIKTNCWYNPLNKKKQDMNKAGGGLNTPRTVLLQMSVKQNEAGQWYVDSGAASHVTGNAGFPHQNDFH